MDTTAASSSASPPGKPARKSSLRRCHGAFALRRTQVGERYARTARSSRRQPYGGAESRRRRRGLAVPDGPAPHAPILHPLAAVSRRAVARRRRRWVQEAGSAGSLHAARRKGVEAAEARWPAEMQARGEDAPAPLALRPGLPGSLPPDDRAREGRGGHDRRSERVRAPDDIAEHDRSEPLRCERGQAALHEEAPARFGQVAQAARPTQAAFVLLAPFDSPFAVAGAPA